MSDRNKKRTSSFRKFLPSLFFKSKEKNISKENNVLKNITGSRNNQYENPRLTNKNGNPEKQFLCTDDDISERIYENLTVLSDQNEMPNNESNSPHSSSSTLVSVSKIKDVTNKGKYESNRLHVTENNYTTYSARPQVPPKPQNDNIHTQSYATELHRDMSSSNSGYPDVYYHSLEKIPSDKIKPIDKIEILRATHTEADPTSVGAEIKKVSTKFLISPKKEAEVRTIQPKRARSFSLDKEQSRVTKTDKKRGIIDIKQTQKPYNYSAPTSPTPTNHKIPNMPETVSPYGYVKKSLNEAEEKKNSLGRSRVNIRVSSPKPTVVQNEKIITIKDPSTETMSPQKHLQKEKTRQKVEAFYWQKLKELKTQEDEYLLKQSLSASSRPYKQAPYCNSLQSSPSPRVTELKTCSLPRGGNLSSYCNNEPIYLQSPFSRNAPERRTIDNVISNKITCVKDEVVYRHPEKLAEINATPVKYVESLIKSQPIYQSRIKLGSQNSLPKRVSFEETSHFHNMENTKSGPQSPVKPRYITTETREGSFNAPPPRPPMRTTSVGIGNLGQPRKYIDGKKTLFSGNYSIYSGSESGSEAGEIQRILQSSGRQEEDWHSDGSRMDGGLSDGEASRGPVRGRTSRRDDPRRHTLAGNHLYLHPHHPGQHNSLEMERYGSDSNAPEYATVNKYLDYRSKHNAIYKKPPLPRGYQPQSNAMLFDDDPGIMSEVETSSTGFRRGGKQRSSLPVVRTPSKTLERPLGLVFLQYRSETKRALLPNEITSIDTVKALFVRSFPKQLTMQYMDSPMVKIYIHDSSKDMFYELEDVRAHLRDIRDRSVLRLFEATDIGGGVFPGAVGVGSLSMPPPAVSCSGPSSWDQDQNYFSEPEIDSEYHHQHVHKSKVKAPAYYMGTAAPSTLPRGGSMLRAYSPAAPPVPSDRIKTLPGAAHSADGYMSSPERGGPRVPYEDPYYTQFLGPAAGRPTITPTIDEEVAGDGVVIEDGYPIYAGLPGQGGRSLARPPYDARLTPQVDDMQRLRVEKMERQLANLTGLVQKALQVPGSAPPPAAPRCDIPITYQTRPPTQDAVRYGSAERPPKLGKDKFQKSVSFEKSVSFSDDPPDMNSPKQHSPQHSADSKPTKPAIKSSTLPRTSSQERDRLKPAPPPKPAGLVGQQLALVPQRTYTINVTPDFFSQMRMLQKQAHDLRMETRNLRRSTLSHAVQMRQLMAETIVKIGDIAASFCEQNSDSLSREEEIYRQDMLLLENDLYELEATVERLRGQAANRETRVNMADIERIAMVLSKSSKTVADWKLKFPILQETMKIKLNSEMEKVVRKEKLLEEEPERLELALRRCKKLTGTLVTLKRLACVQEQRLPITDGRVSPTSSQSSTFCSTAGPSSEEFPTESMCPLPAAHPKGPANGGGRGSLGRAATDIQRPENALDALLDELQTFAKPSERERSGRGEGSLRRLHSYPSGSDTDASPPVCARGHHPPKPPVPDRHPELLAMAARRAPPPPPPRTTSRSPLASPTSPASPPRARSDSDAEGQPPETNSPEAASRQAVLEQRHQELLKKQRALQEQYARLQMIQRSGPALPPAAQPDLKKTGSESNLLSKMNLNLAPAAMSGSMTHLVGFAPPDGPQPAPPTANGVDGGAPPPATTNKVYETDIL